MTKTIWTWVGAVVLAAALLGASVWAITGVMDRPSDREMNSITETGPIDPVKQDPAIADQSALVQGFSWAPAEQRSDLDSFVNAPGDVVTQRLRDEAKVAAEQQPPQALPRQWQAWADAKDRVHARVTPGESVVSEDTAQVLAHVEQEVQHQDGDATPLSKFEVTTELALDTATGQWQLDKYTITTIEY